MAVKASGSQLAFSEIVSEFGDNDTSSLGGYRVRTGGATYPQSFAGGLSFSSLDTGIPSSGEIKFSDFYSKKLNVVIDFHSGSQEIGKSAKTRYNSNNVTIIGGYASRPTITNGKKIFAYVNKTIGSPFNFSTSVVITPRSSAIIGRYLLPRSFFTLFKSVLPGEFIHFPIIADLELPLTLQ